MHGWQGGLLLTRCRHRVALTQSWPPTLFIEIKEKEGNSRILAIRNNFICCITQFFRWCFLKVSLKVLDSCVWVSMSHSHRFPIQSERWNPHTLFTPLCFQFPIEASFESLIFGGRVHALFEICGWGAHLAIFCWPYPETQACITHRPGSGATSVAPEKWKKQINKASRILIGCIQFLAECCPLAIFFSY